MQDTTAITIPHDHPAFAGHFPGQPIVPGVVLLDEALHALGRLLQQPLHHYQIASAKFLSPVGPGAQLLLSYEIKANGSARFDISSGERKVASGSITLLAPETSR